MDLSVMDRVILLGTLPAEGDITTLKIVRTLREALSFSEAEHTRFEIVVADGKVTWNAATARDKSVEIGPKAQRLIADALEKLNEAKRLRAEHIDLYDRFVGSGKD